MKTKITITIIIGIVALVISSFQSIESKQNYNSIDISTNNYDLKQHQHYVSQAVVGCVKCHDCQKDNLIIQDSIKINIQTYFQNLKPTVSEILKTEKTPINQEKSDWPNNESPDNFKMK